jgi:CubicO group peptidase (beta-lactamase class C family)
LAGVEEFFSRNGARQNLTWPSAPHYGPVSVDRRAFGRLAGLTGAALALPRTTATAKSRTWRVAGRCLLDPADFDATVGRFMRRRGIACGALAVAVEGRLVLARGYTWSADLTLDTRPTSLFRIASISKPVTATAVLRLIEQGRLGPEDGVARILGLSKAADPRLAGVTVLHLLRHTGGWDRRRSGDPMFDDAAIAEHFGTALPVGPDDIVRYATARGLDHTPGSRFAYSNFGYLLLGRLIEEVTGTAYAEHVGHAVLAPLGIGRMRLGRTLVRTRAEVPYRSQFTGPTVMDPSGRQVPGPYGTFNHENNAFNCGWLASAVDLARFARVYDGTTPVLSRSSISRALARTAGGSGPYYGCGWHVRPIAWGHDTWHSGSLPGTYALLVRRFDGVTLAVLFDQRDDPSGERYTEIDQELQETADAVGTWPPGALTGEEF